MFYLKQFPTSLQFRGGNLFTVAGDEFTFIQFQKAL